VPSAESYPLVSSYFDTEINQFVFLIKRRHEHLWGIWKDSPKILIFVRQFATISTATTYKKLNSVALVRQRQPLVVEVSANFRG
jgi:hypothetical protein